MSRSLKGDDSIGCERIDASGDPVFLDAVFEELEAEPGRIGHGDHAGLGADHLGDRLPEVGPFLDDEFEQAQRVGDAGQEVERGGDVQVRGEAVIDDREARGRPPARRS